MDSNRPARGEYGNAGSSIPYTGPSGPLRHILGDGVTEGSFTLNLSPREVGPRISRDAASPKGRLLLDTGQSIPVTISIPAALYLKMEQLSLEADIDAIMDDSRTDREGLVREVNHWEITGRFMQDMNLLEISEITRLDRIFVQPKSSFKIAEYLFPMSDLPETTVRQSC